MIRGGYARITRRKGSVLVLHLVEAELCWLDMVSGMSRGRDVGCLMRPEQAHLQGRISGSFETHDERADSMFPSDERMSQHDIADVSCRSHTNILPQ
jgi:hypothetical protein